MPNRNHTTGKPPEGAKYAPVTVARPAFQGVGVDLCGAEEDEDGYLPEESYQYADRTKRLMTNPVGYAYFPSLLDSEPNKSERDRLLDTRHRPMTEKQRKYQKAQLLMDSEDNQASEAQRENG